ncbi:unnamed protein product [Mycena citricolor]|uniref:DUF221-domain-containing protein n=1 Tax=Mycena citricolor TaxID=2018698 RepID=A0AAD2GYG0_9AGAR|nr:unnamed protein product [Mycena citricolor]
MSQVTQSSVNSSNSTQTFLTSLVVNGTLLAVEVIAFVILKSRLGRIYSPRTYLPPPAKRAQALPPGWWRWVPALLVQDPQEIIQKNGLDAYMLLRYLRLLIIIFSAFTIFISAVIIPVDTVGMPNSTGKDRINRITWSNIGNNQQDQKRFAAHIIMAYLQTFFVIFMIRREMLHFLDMRHRFLISNSHSRLAQAKTVLITSVPDELANEHDLRLFASFVPGGIDRVWMYRDTKALNELFKQRQAACSKLETAASGVLKHATDAWRLKEATHQKTRKHKSDEEKGAMPLELELPDGPTPELLQELVPAKKLPTHRTGFLGLFGEKVDTIPWCTEEIARLNRELEDGRREQVQGKFLGSVFIRCNLQLGAHVLAQCVSYHKPLSMKNKWMEANPKDIVWENLDDGSLEVSWRFATSWLATIALIVAWIFPVTFIGTLSQISTLCSHVPWLNWICLAPHPIPGIIQGIIPPLLLAIFFAVLPLILRGLAWYECIPRYSLMSVSVYHRYYLFLLFHGFLIITISSNLSNIINNLVNNPSTAVQNMAKQLPGVSVFFLTLMVTQGLAGAGAALAQLFPLLFHFIRKWLTGRTPRQAFTVTFLMPAADFGLILPTISLLATIGFSYSMLNPMINLFALLSFVMFFIAYKFLLTQVFDQPDESETGGMYFPMCMSNLFVGLYIEQICLACLFFLKASISPQTAVVEAVMMLILVGLTAAAHIMINTSFGPMTEFLPMSLATKKMAKRYEKHQQKQGDTTALDHEEDMFQRNALRSVRRRIQRLPKQLDSTLVTLRARVKEEGEYLASPSSKRKHKFSEDTPRESFDPSSTDSPSTSHDPASPPPTTEGEGQKQAEKQVIADLPEGDAPELYRPKSPAPSHTSERPRASRSRTRTQSKTTRPGRPSIDSRDLSDEDVSTDDEEDTDEHAFDHPSTYMPQPTVWLPKDRLGISELLIGEMRAAGVDASDLGASMDARGVVEVTRNPPDEVWEGGNDE